MRARTFATIAFLTAIVFTTASYGQIAAPPRVGPIPSEGNEGLRPNALGTAQQVAMPNNIIQPIPLTAAEKEAALAGIDKHLVAEIAKLKISLKNVLPDEIATLAKTAGWKPADQQALVVALRAMDPTAVYETWTKGNTQDTAGAEITARQTDARRAIARLEQDAEKNKAALRQDMTDLDSALTKVAAATPGVNDVGPAVASLDAWVEARRFVDSATPANGPIAPLPQGKIALIYDPSVPRGTAIVLSKEAMIIGSEGQPGLRIVTGTAVEALGLPVVTGTPVGDLQSPEMKGGILLVNRGKNNATVNYNLNGTHYVMEAGMSQRLDNDRKWVVEYDRGQGLPPLAYTLSPGTFYFTPSDMGWQLFRQRYDIAIDNTENHQEFNFVFQGQNQTVPAGATKTLTSDYPIVVQYDRGNGTETVTKMMFYSGNVQVGMNVADNKWDLFPTNDNQREVTALRLFR